MENQPVARAIQFEELQGDTLTPISIFRKMKGKKFLFESSLKHEHSGRYSFIAAEPLLELKGFTGKTILISKEEETILTEKPLEVLKELIPIERNLDFKNIPFIGGAVGFVGYDAIRDYEDIGKPLTDVLHIPDIHFMIFEEIIVYDHLKQKVYIAGLPLLEYNTDESLKAKILARKESIQKRIDDPFEESAVISTYEAFETRDSFIEKIERAKEHIVEGDIFQVVLSQRMKAEMEGNPFSFYRKLRIQNPSPYMYYLDFEDYVVAGSSPESLIKVNGDKVYTNPIAGTRPRGKTADEDFMFETDLKQDEKELSEHQMLLDLGRNDLGRVSEFGSVNVETCMKIEKYQHVMHLVSVVSGKIKNPYTPIDALIACLPAGTVSGAPKIRAMELINELEEVKRGVYSGAVGYYSANGNMDFALAIRTMIVKDQTVYIQAGAGIVNDSIPEKEYEETLQKLNAFLEADYDSSY